MNRTERQLLARVRKLEGDLKAYLAIVNASIRLRVKTIPMREHRDTVSAFLDLAESYEDMIELHLIDKEVVRS